MRNESIVIGDITCHVRGGGPCPRKVFVYNFPFEADNGLLARARNKFGEVKDVYNRCWLHLSGVADGVRLVSMVCNKAIPQNLGVEGFRVKISYYGQAVECDVCERLDHIARDCPLKGKCLWCHQSGHLARECVNPRADSSDVPGDCPADPASVASPSLVAQPTPLADSNSVSTDSLASVSSPVLLDSPVVGAAMEEGGSSAGLSGGDDNISDSFSLDSISDIDQNCADNQRNVEQSSINIEQSTGNIEESINVEQSRSNVVQSMTIDKDNKPSAIEQNTVNVEQSTSNVVQSSINVEQNIDLVNVSSDKCSSVNVVADSQPAESFSSSEDHCTWAEVVYTEYKILVFVARVR